MRFVLTLACMALIVVTAAVIALIDVLVRLLPLLILAAALIAAVRVAKRRRGHAPAPQFAPPAIVNVPDSAAFRAMAEQSRVALRPAVSTTHPVNHDMVIDGDVVNGGGPRG